MAQSPSSAGSRSSQQQSPAHSFQHQQHADADIPTDTLIQYLVAAKRSLSSIHLVHRATTVLSDARTTVESAAAVIARTKYLRRSLASQLKLLRGIQFEIEGGAQAVKSEIQAVLTDLEGTDRKLAENISLLKATQIEAGFKDHAQREVDAAAGVPPKEALHDFVDDRPVDEVKISIQLAIDEVEAAETRIDQNMRSLEEELQNINAALDNSHENQTALSASVDSQFKQKLNVSRTLKSLEDHAREMAVSLESLVKHFDMCVTAIKHTEGAGALVAKTVTNDDLPEGVDVYDLTAPTNTDLSEDERVEMLQVLANDAAEVDEVVMEISDRAAEMDATLDRLFQWRDRHQQDFEEVQLAFRLLEGLGGKLPTYVAETSTFALRWHESKLRIIDGQSALAELSGVYEQFLDSYDGLIVEVARRRTVKKQMMQIIQEAHQRLESLYEDDLNERDVFRNERGDFLPSDIWAGLGSLPPRWVIQRLDQNSMEGEGGGVYEDSIPDLPKKTVQEALARLRRKMREDDNRGGGGGQMTASGNGSGSSHSK